MSKANPRYRRNNPLLPLPTNNVYRVRVTGLLEGQLTMSVLYYADELQSGTATPITQDALFQALNQSNKLFSMYRAAMPTEWTYGQIFIDCPTSPSLSTYTSGLTGAGTAGSGHAPTMNAVTIAKYTGFKGQCGRGRVNLPGILTANIANSVVANISPYSGLLTEMMAGYLGGGHTYTPGIFSKGNRTTKQYGWAPLTKVVLRLLLGTNRRRKIGRGV